MTSETKKPAGYGAYELVRTVVRATVIILLLSTFVLRLVQVDGESMRETLQHGDGLLALSSIWYDDYQAEDIVILRKESFHDGAPVVKRVIATGGQTVDIDFNAGVVYVDGEALEEDYVREPTWTPEGLEFPVTLEENEIFVLGDNRNHSGDSRDPSLGPVDTRLVIGKAVFLALPGETAGLGLREWSRIGLLN